MSWRKIKFYEGNDDVFFAYKLNKNIINNNKKPVLVICPGGGFVYCSNSEGFEIEENFSKENIFIIILHYSVYDSNQNIREGDQFNELKKVFKWIQMNSEKFDLDIENIHLLGFSAGGNLVLNFCNEIQIDEDYKDNFNRAINIKSVIAGYPRLIYSSLQKDVQKAMKLSAKDDNDVESLTQWFAKRNKSIFGKENPDNIQIQRFSPLLHVTEKHPPLFVFQARDDDTTPVSELLEYIDLLEKNKTSYQVKIFNHGGHGFGDGSSRSNKELLKTWISEAIDWILRGQRNDKV